MKTITPVSTAEVSAAAAIDFTMALLGQHRSLVKYRVFIIKAGNDAGRIDSIAVIERHQEIHRCF
ncbi:hypothetical protein D3C83_168870 [compost metagenome]